MTIQSGKICTKPLVIGLSGKIGCGKTTVSELLCQLLQTRLGMVVARTSFGGILKEAVAHLFGFPVEWCYCIEGKDQYVKLNRDFYVLKEDTKWFKDDFCFTKQIAIVPHVKGLTVRNLLQWWGTEVARRHNPDYWADLWLYKVRSSPIYNIILVDDVRFPNEVETIRNKVGIGGVYRIAPYVGWDKHCEHESETALDDWDFGADYWYRSPEYGHNALQALAWDIYQDIESGEFERRVAENLGVV